MSENTKKAERLRSRKVRNIILTTVCTLIALYGLGVAIHFFWDYSTHEITNDASIEGYVSPINIRVSGYIKEIRFNEHQSVKQGDTLLILDKSEYLIKLKEANAALMDALSSGNVLNSNINTTELGVEVYQANIDETRAKLTLLEQDDKRNIELLRIEAISDQQYETKKSELDAMRAHMEALVKQKEAAISQSKESKNKRGNISSAILVKEAAVESALLNLSYTVVTAPTDGTIGRRSLSVGQYVQTGQTLSYIVQDDSKWVTANYKETQIENIYVGQETSITVDAISGKTFSGVVSEISGATGSKYSLLPTDNSAGNFVKIQQRIPVRIELTDLTPQDRQALRVGMMVRCSAIKR